MITQDFQSTKSPEETPGWLTDPPHCYILVSLLSDRAGLRAGSHDWVRACSSLDIGWSTRGMSVSRPSLTMAFILRPGSLWWPSLPSPSPLTTSQSRPAGGVRLSAPASFINKLNSITQLNNETLQTAGARQQICSWPGSDWLFDQSPVPSPGSTTAQSSHANENW